MTDQFCDLLIRGCNVNTADGEGLTSLHYAANYNKYKSIEAILHLIGSPIYYSLLLRVFSHFNNTNNRIIVNIGPDSVKNIKGKQHKAHHNEFHLVVDAKDKYGWTPLYCASHHGSTECVKILLHELGTYHMTLKFITSNMLLIFKFSGADVTVRNNVGKTALHAAMGQNRSAIAELLVHAGASLNAKDSKGMTPLHECAYR
jgi:ankyrin repeat protein